MSNTHSSRRPRLSDFNSQARKLLYSDNLSKEQNRIYRRSLLVRLLSSLLIVCMLTVPVLAVPETPKVLLVTFDELKNDIRYAVASNGVGMSFMWFDTLKELISGTKGKQEVLERIEIQPVNGDNTLTIVQGQTVDFSAIGYRNGQAANAINFEWTIATSDGTGSPRKLNNGRFTATRPGVYTVTATGEGSQGSITVRVNLNEGYYVQKKLNKPDSERSDRERQIIQTMKERGILVTRDINSRGDYDSGAEALLVQANRQKLETIRARQEARRQQYPNPIGQATIPSASEPETQADTSGEPQESKQLEPENERVKGGPSAVDEHKEYSRSSRKAVVSAPAVVRLPEDDGWGGDDWYTADDPGNAVGSPAGSAPDAGAGNGNFQIAAPVLSLGGRGVDLNLDLVYNSRLWNKSGTVMKYDSDAGFPGPGWSIGFGKMIYMGSTGGCMIVTADGTRRSHTGTNSTYSYGTSFWHSYTGKTSDGSFIDFSCSYSDTTYGKSLSGSATLANGTTITYGSPTGKYDQLFPTKITDAQGNYINITYVNNQGPRINTITDTLGRVVTFEYDANSRLIAITGPGHTGTTRTYIRLHYKQITLSYFFASGLTADTPTNTPWVVDAIYYPDTNLGYWFDDSDSYSSYGMIAKVISQRGMSWSGTPGTPETPGTQGTVTQGTTYRTEAYNFPLTGGSPANSDAPVYTTHTETWDKMNTAAVVTGYEKTTSGGDEIITITRPDGSVEKQTSDQYGYWFQNDVLSGSTVLAKTRTYFAAGAYSSTRPTKIEVTDSLGQMTHTDFTYGTNYNQLTSQKDYTYGNTLYRQTNYTYENNAAYTNRHIFSLVKSTEIVDNAGVRLSKTEYEYDNNAVVNGTQNHGLVAVPNSGPNAIVMHNYTSDPWTSEIVYENGECLNFVWNYEGCTYENEEIWVPTAGGYWDYCHAECTEYEQVPVSAYEQNSIFRGNVTKTTSYSNAANLTGAISHDYTYDIVGNQRTATTDCCQQMSFDYTVNTQYSQPESQTKGSPDPNSPHRMTQSATYDFNTGVVKTSTDFNGRTTTASYDSVVRPYLVTAPTGAKTTTDYGDTTFIPTRTVQNSDNTIVSKSQTELNGRGQPVVSGYYVDATNTNKTSIQYDEMGRKKKVSMPYASSGSPAYWTEYTYDHLSRVTQFTAPDGSTSKTFFNEAQKPDSATSSAGQTVRSQDAWGRERWARTDDFGRLVEVVEPNPQGSATTPSINVALASNGGATSASSQNSAGGNFPVSSINNGDRKGQGWGSGGGWGDNTYNSWPDWVQIDFNGSKTINEIDVFTIQDNYSNPAEPTETMTFSTQGNTSFNVQYWDGSAWVTVSGGSVTGNNKVWRKFTFSAVSTSKIRVTINSSLNYYSRIAEVEAWTPAVTSSATGSVFDPGSMRTEYSYDRLDQLTQITQGAQTRSFKYDSLGRLTRQKLAEQTATLGDNGQYVEPGNQTPKVWSDAFVYDDRSNLTQRTDARGVRTNFSYQIGGYNDPLNRLQGISYDKTGADATYTIHDAPGVSIEYMTTGDKARVKKVITAGFSTEENTYDTEGRVTDYTMTLDSRASYPFVTSYQYDTASRLTEIRYPAQYGMAGSPRKVITPSYDQASRLTELTVDAQTQLNEIVYNPMSQVTSLKTGQATGNADIEQYDYNDLTGLLTEQRVYKASDMVYPILRLGYEYNRGNSVGNTTTGKTGELTHMINYLDRNKDRAYEHDALGRLIKAKGGLATGITGVTADWMQEYSYDRYGNKTGTTASGITADSNSVPTDGLPSLAYNTASNRINSTDWEYDLAGNQTRGQNENGVWLRFECDAAGRLVKVLADNGIDVIESYKYGASRKRLVNETSAGRNYYAWGGQAVIAEYAETSTTPVWSKSYLYAGSRLLSTGTNSGGSEDTQFHHPERLGTKLVTNPAAGGYFEQSTLPFGTPLGSESTGFSNQVFTSYDRSSATGLGYALNRTYSQGQSRFTQADPIGVGAASLGNPQSNNLYAYVQNNPVDFMDPMGLCTLNINIKNVAGVANSVIQSAKDEMRRIYAAAGINLVFDSPRHPGINTDSSYTFTIQEAGNDVGGTFANAGETVIYNYGYGSTENLAASIRSGKLPTLGMHNKNFGRALGRVGAHETGHFFLQVGNSYHSSSNTLMQRGFNGEEWWQEAYNSTHKFTAAEAEKIRARCPREPISAPPTEIFTSFGGGGGDGGVGGYFGGYPSWWYYMWDFLNWIDSIPVGVDDGDGDGTQLG